MYMQDVGMDLYTWNFIYRNYSLTPPKVTTLCLYRQRYIPIMHMQRWAINKKKKPKQKKIRGNGKIYYNFYSTSNKKNVKSESF